MKNNKTETAPKPPQNQSLLNSKSDEGKPLKRDKYARTISSIYCIRRFPGKKSIKVALLKL